jgi:predicted dehydrogenase
MKRLVRIGLIGAGFIGRSHGLAVRAVNGVFPECPIDAEPHILADDAPGKAERAAAALGFRRATADWREAVDAADAVIIAVPSNAHAEIARRAIAQGKPLLCEKPVGLSSDEAQSLADAAGAAGVVNGVGFTYLRSPLVRHSRRLIDEGVLGRLLHFYGRHFEDYLASPEAPFSWRLSATTAGRCGALGDLGCHILSIARYLCGPVEALVGSSAVRHAERPTGEPGAPLRRVENEDHAAALMRFAGGAPGVIETSRVALGRKMDLTFEITGERGTLRFEAERMNEIGLYLDEKTAAGFRRILIEPAHPDYGAFLPAPGHGLGFNDLKTIEIKAFLDAIAAGENAQPDLAEAARISRLCEAILDSAASGQWVQRPEDAPSSHRTAA